MAEKVPNLRVQFCKSIQSAAERNTSNLFTYLQSDLQLYDETEKLEYIHSRRNNLRKKLKGSDYKKYFPVKGIETNLTNCLEKYYDVNLICLTPVKESGKEQKKRNFAWNITTRAMAIYLLLWLLGIKLDFSRLHGFKPMTEYIAWGKLFLELNRLEAQYKNGNIFSPVNNLPPMIPTKEKLREDLNVEILNQPSNCIKNPPIFQEGAYELFCYLKSEYLKKEDKSPKAKYSNIFHFLKYNHLITGTQIEYIEFIENQMNVRLSKILSPKYKYTDTELPLLSRLKSDFDKKKKLEH